ncbi:MAG: hypothetical protein QG553_941 [Patescibacteria group bacterium]|nr:hypothetical protein [Patescibacteria group bacterium]
MPEFQGLPLNPEVELRTAVLANDYATLHAFNIKQIIAPYVSPSGNPNIPESTAAHILLSEHKKAKEAFCAERNAGHYNDLESTVAHGVTALIFEAAVSSVEKVFPEDARSTEMPVLEPLGCNSRGSEMFCLRFSEGHFRIPTEVVVPVVDFFPTETEPSATPQTVPARRGPAEPMPWVIPNPAEKPLDQRVLWLPQTEVVRIHADGGELWQNPNFTPLGIPVEAN